MVAHDGRNADFLPGSAKLTSYKPLIALIGACIGFVAVGFLFDAIGYNLWAGLFGAMAVIFFVSILIAIGLFWVLKIVGF